MLTGISGSYTDRSVASTRSRNVACAARALSPPVGTVGFVISISDVIPFSPAAWRGRVPPPACARAAARPQRCPGQGRARDAHRESRAAPENGELVEVCERVGRIFFVLGGEAGVEALEHRADLGLGLALDRFGHQRGRRQRNGATATLEAHIGDATVLDRKEYGHL